MSIQWFPGHIAKAIKDIKNDIKLVDIVIEILDARAPISTKNNLTNSIIKDKKHLIVLNKSDMSDSKKNDFYINYYKNNGYNVIKLNSLSKIDKIIIKNINNICKDIVENKKNKGISNYVIKAMVIGMPNVGKSTFINSYVNKKITKVENQPGITKKNQWIKIDKNILLLDTPGITEHKFSSDNVSYNLMLINSINDNLIDKQELIFIFLQYLIKEYPNLLIERYRLDKDLYKDSQNQTLEVFNNIAYNFKCIKTGNNIDYDKTAKLILEDFRSERLGKITLNEII